MVRPRRNTRLLGAAGALCALSAAPAARSQQVVPVVAFNNAVYHYAYTVTNNTPDDLFDLTIHVAPGVGMVQNLTAPAGFMTSYDSGLGLVDFLEDTSNFTATPLSGFAFDSPLAPQQSTFDANLTDGNGNISTLSGPVLAPLAAVPEPGTLALALLAAPSLILIARRRRASFTVDRLTQGDHTP